MTRFQSTHSLRSATYYEGAKRFAYVVSIHALLAECDIQRGLNSSGGRSFNPRTPCGVRHPLNLNTYRNSGFQSTHSLRSATATPEMRTLKLKVSIHALLAECDVIQLKKII